MKTIANYGGYWGNADSGRAGVFKRDVFYTITGAFNIVASSNIQISKYMDHHDVDEELRTFIRQGGQCVEYSLVGITYRYIFNSSSYAADDVALMKNKD